MTIDEKDLNFDLKQLFDGSYTYFRKLLGEFTVRECYTTLIENELVLAKNTMEQLKQSHSGVFIEIDQMYLYYQLSRHNELIDSRCDHILKGGEKRGLERLEEYVF